jgi:hypothetical protein
MATLDTTTCTPLRRVREARGLRLEDVASAAGVSIRTVFDAERGRHEPRRASKAVARRHKHNSPHAARDGQAAAGRALEDLARVERRQQQCAAAAARPTRDQRFGKVSAQRSSW